ncbi:MAG: hypothetical protein ACYC0V_13075, partial [Armatimonadota bacterium]
GGYRVYNRNDEFENAIHPDISGKIFAWAVAGAGIPAGASLISRKSFFASGGWDPSLLLFEDHNLMIKISTIGSFASTATEVAQFRCGPEGSSSDWSAKKEYWQIRVEKAFTQPDCYNQLNISLREHNQAELRAQLVRRYLSSAQYNTANGSILVSLSRTFTALKISLPALLNTGFWRSLAK